MIFKWNLVGGTNFIHYQYFTLMETLWGSLRPLKIIVFNQIKFVVMNFQPQANFYHKLTLYRAYQDHCL